MNDDPMADVIAKYEACEREFADCLRRVTDLLDGDPRGAIDMFKDYAKKLKRPRKPRPRRISKRDQKFQADYKGAGRGERDAFLEEAGTDHKIKPRSVLRAVRRANKNNSLAHRFRDAVPLDAAAESIRPDNSAGQRQFRSAARRVGKKRKGDKKRHS